MVMVSGGLICLSFDCRLASVRRFGWAAHGVKCAQQHWRAQLACTRNGGDHAALKIPALYVSGREAGMCLSRLAAVIYCDGNAVVGAPASAGYLAKRITRRNPLPLLMVVAIALIVLFTLSKHTAGPVLLCDGPATSRPAVRRYPRHTVSNPLLHNLGRAERFGRSN